MNRILSSRRATDTDVSGRLRRGALATALLTLCLAPAAGASTIDAVGDALVLRAAPGELNNVYLDGSYNPTGRVRFEDSAGITAYPLSCTARGETTVDCDVPGRIRLELGDLGDLAGFMEDWAWSLPVSVDGGDGNDRLDGNHRADGAEELVGGPGNDRITGFGGDDVLRGGAGDDVLDGGAGNDGVYGEDGNDEVAGDGQAAPGSDVVDGGAGSDKLAEYVQYATDVHPDASVSLDGVANDGRPGEADNVVGIERSVAYVAGTFVLTDGAEDWQVWSNMNSGASTVFAGGGDDKITGEDAVETIDGGAGDDRLEGGKNHDTITGGPGRDLIYGDDTDASCNTAYVESCVLYGNDVIHAVDGEVDTIDCGAGADTVNADPADVVAANCEIVTRAAGGGGAAGTPRTAVPAAKRAAALKLSAVKAKLRTALRKGLLVRVAGAPKGKLTVTARYGKRIVARGTAKVGTNGRASVRLKFTKRAKRTLRSKRRITLKVTAGKRTTTIKLTR